MEFHEFNTAIREFKSAKLPEAVALVIEHDIANLDSAVRFELTTTPPIFARVDGRIAKLPYERMLIRVRVNDAFGKLDVYYFVERMEDSWGVDVFWADGNRGRGLAFLGGGALRPDLNLDFYDFGQDNEAFNAEMLHPLWHFLMLLHESGQRIEVHCPSRKLNRKRVLNGKHPLVEFRTLIITKPSPLS